MNIQLFEPQHNKETKRKEIDALTEHIDDAQVVAAVNIQGLPSKQLNEMRAELRGDAQVRMSKVTLIKRAFEKSQKEDITELSEHFKGMPALLFTEKNPFKLFQLLKESKSPAPIKAGQEAPKDIVIPEGPTSFAPGPILGQLGGMGVKAGIEGGKVAVKKDAVVAEEGDIVDEDLAGILNRLEIYPVEIGLNITAVYEDGSILTRNVLDIEIEEYKTDVMVAASDAFKLATAQHIATPETITHLVQDAHRNARTLAIEQAMPTTETITELLGKANSHGEALHKHT